MAEWGDGLRRRSTKLLAVALMATVLLPLSAPTARATAPSWRDGEEGSGPAPFRFRISRSDRTRMPSTGWTDLGPDDRWAKAAIDHVAGAHDWMRDYAPDAEGNWRFRPDAIETRARWASALVQAFAPDETPDPAITFPDLEQTDPAWPSAAIAVAHRWLVRGPDGRFNPEGFVEARTVHRSLILVLGMGDTAEALDELSTEGGGHVFDTPRMFGFNLLAMRLGLRFNNKVDEAQDVTPGDHLRRKQVAWSLYRATTLDDWVVPYLEDQYAGMALPRMTAARRSIVDWGVRYVGYPYIWGGEWGLETPEPPAFGAQPGPGFDCSGLSWWALRRDDGPWQVSPPRPYRGWPLPQRTSAEMSRMTKTRLGYRKLAPGDLMFYDGDRDGVVDHVDVFVGNGWALDSSSSVGGVTLMWVKSGWYRDHFVHGRRIVPRR
jgi:cell wall-associated NlpC family hydrolase